MEKKKKMDGPKMVRCWYCDRLLSKRQTRALPNGARVCRVHECIICGDLLPPSTCKILNDAACCGKHLAGAIRMKLKIKGGRMSEEDLKKLQQAHKTGTIPKPTVRRKG